MPRKKLGAWGNIYEQPDCKGLVIRWVDAYGKRKGRVLRGATVKEARAILAAEKLKIEEARKFGKPLPSEETFTQWADEYLDLIKRSISSHVERGRMSQGEYIRQHSAIKTKLRPFFGPMRLALIRRSDVIRYIHSRTGRVAAGTLTKEMGVLRRMLSVALDLEKIAANPATRVPLPRVPEGRTRFLTPDEWHRVFEACYNPEDAEQWMQQAAGLAVSLGLRRGEMMAITPQDVDLKARHIRLTHTKNGKPRTVFINQLAMQVLTAMRIEERQARDDRRPFFHGIRPGTLSTRFIRACQAAGVDDFSFHDLRHTHASWLRMRGADINDLRLLLGHSDIRMTSRYIHLTAQHLADAASKLDGVLTLPAPKPA
jgi:integrase